MSAEINYKNKYMALRAKYMADLDMAFRLGMEQGAMQQQQQQMQEQQAQQQAMEAAMNGQQPGEEGGTPGEGGAPGEGAPAEGQPPGQPSEGGAPMDAQGGSELDQHISQLESMISKSENLSKDPEIKKSLESLKSLRKAEHFKAEMRKSDAAVKVIAKALQKPGLKFGAQSSHNLSSNAKQAVSLQHKIVNDVLAKMEEEEKRASNEIKNILSIEGLTKKE